MAEQYRVKPKVTLTLDPDVRAAADQLLRELPGKVSLSALVDMLLADFVGNVGPMVKRLAEADPLERVTVMHQLVGQQMFEFGAELQESMKEAESARANQESSSGKE